MAYSATQLQLTHILQHLYRRIGSPVTTATGGSTSTAIDTKMADALGEGNEDDIFIGGTLVVVKDAAGAAAAPEGEFSRITDYVASTATLTISPLVTAAIASGDTFLYATPDYPLEDMIQVVNDALGYLGDIPLVDTTLTTAAAQTEYALPVALKRGQLLDVEYQGKTGDSNDNQWLPVTNWTVKPAAPGSTGLLIIPQLVASRTLKLTYLGRHPVVATYAADIAECITPDLVHAVVFAHAIQWKNDGEAAQGAQNKARLALEEKAWSQVDRAMQMYPINRPIRRIPGFEHWSGSALGDLGVLPPPA